MSKKSDYMLYRAKNKKIKKNKKKYNTKQKNKTNFLFYQFIIAAAIVGSLYYLSYFNESYFREITNVISRTINPEDYLDIYFYDFQIEDYVLDQINNNR